MDEKLSQAFLYRKRNIIRQEINPLHLSKEQKSYTRGFIHRHRKKFKFVILLILGVVLLKIGILLLSDFFIRKYSFQLDIKSLYLALFGLLVLAGLYLFISFLSIKYEKALIILFINDIRRQWVSLFLKKPLFALKHRDKGTLLARISYHFPLLQMGLSNAFFGSFHFLILTIGLILVTFFINTTLLVIVLIMIPVNLLIFFIGYVIARYYIGQEQTLYSRILRFISDIFSEFPLVKLNHKERAVIRDLDHMVDLDSYFRVRRELWLKFGYRIIFIALAIVAAGFYLVEIHYPFLEIEHSGQYIVYTIVFGLLVQLLYLSLRVGLFSFPLRLGLALCVSDRFPVSEIKEAPVAQVKEITFKTPKVKLSRKGGYVKNLEYTFKQGERILITGAEGSGKSSLGYVFAGLVPDVKGKPWIVKISGKRFSYKHWKKKMTDLYIIDPHLQTEMTVFETFSRENLSQKSTAGEVKEILGNLGKYPELSFIFDHPKALGKKLNKVEFSFVEMALLQMAYCLFYEPSILVVDNLWLDMNHKRINDTLKVLDKNLKKTIIICFATRDNNIILYDQKYSL